MFEAKAMRRLAPTYAFITECGLHGRLDVSLFVDRGKLRLRPGDGANGREYRILRPRISEMVHEMRFGDTLIATAENGQRLETWSEVSWSGHSFRLERDGLLGSTFCLLEGTRNCGELRRRSWWGGGMIVDLSLDLPIELRCFVLALAIFRWRAMIATASP